MMHGREMLFTESARRYSALLVLALFATVMPFGPASHAAIITYAPPALPGTNLSYIAVSESSGTDPVPLYGAPTVSGNNLVFSNMNFTASSVNGAPTDFTDGQVNITMLANPGSFIQSIQWNENGDYNVTPFPNVSSINSAKVFSQALQITVLAINGVPLATPLVDNTSVTMALSPNGGTYTTGITPNTGSWQAAALANLATLFGSNKITEVAISYDNQLAAASQVGGIASISKKGVTIDPNVITPEPASLSIAGVVALGLLSSRRRQARQA